MGILLKSSTLQGRLIYATKKPKLKTKTKVIGKLLCPPFPGNRFRIWKSVKNSTGFKMAKTQILTSVPENETLAAKLFKIQFL